MSDVVGDDYVTIRNNRFVIPVRAGAAGRVSGVVQDRSISGETLFVEPLFAVEPFVKGLQRSDVEFVLDERSFDLPVGSVSTVRLFAVHDLFLTLSWRRKRGDAPFQAVPVPYRHLVPMP